MSSTRCGLVAIVGRPNVGKSTLMNHLIGQKVSITSRKPQTTRHRIHGILSRDDYQIVFADTPGIHTGEGKALNRAMNEAAMSALSGVDVICFMVDGMKWTEGDEHVLGLLQRAGDTPVLLLVNKVDSLEDKNVLLPHLQTLASRFSFAEVIPVSALRGHNLEALEQALASRLPEGDFWFEEDQLTDRSLRFMVAEIIREKVVRQLGQEVPHQMTVEIDLWEDGPKVTDIAATILVERRGQKKILIGDQGARIKQIGTQARQDIERLIERKVMLNLWVKIKAGWSDDERALRSLGYDRNQ
ncbi:GTPase Era [Alloalcanivorax gelatiniphagus]|uniref:GTPase Era n=1 Tax=Alloalcanivorax gelatiniphagus TaxID=1194167 RepID=A0ABY2XM23_9GAMM|nr:GTPase Era [Alloalcanivorax gelatiniphagus]TMW12730.1 GTPase Era [Alloalcanivorax gelatiniphagus]|tara:strand:+ start:4723 stop:5622 length:900 start_codon:yes stop_codon:yes gene_type:complete